MGIKNTAGINYQRQKVLDAVASVEEVLERIKTELGQDVKEDDVSVSHVNMEWWLASSTKLTQASAEHDVAVAYGMGG
jgi:hypothetical protein